MKEQYPIKPEFEKRLKQIFNNENDYNEFEKIIRTESPDSIRCNTLKISPEKLKARLEKKGWQIDQPFLEFPEIMILKNRVFGGELGKSKEHLLGYYYVQDISSMLPMMALKPQPGDFLLDLCSSPGSKTTQAASMMENQGTIIANDNNMGRIKILASNLERCGVTNTIITKMDGAFISQKFLKKTKFRFDKILVDAPCSGEGTLRKSPKTLLMWNEKFIKNLAGIQKKLVAEAIKILKTGGEMIYSTCTHSPEENELILDFLINQFDIQVQEINLPLKLRSGICEWNGKTLDKEVCKSRRLYPQDNNTEGFFLCKIKKLSEKGCEERR